MEKDLKKLIEELWDAMGYTPSHRTASFRKWSFGGNLEIYLKRLQHCQRFIQVFGVHPSDLSNKKLERLPDVDGLVTKEMAWRRAYWHRDNLLFKTNKKEERNNEKGAR